MFEGLGEKLAYTAFVDPSQGIAAFGKIGGAAKEAAAQADKAMAAAKKRVEDLTLAASRAEQVAIRAEARAAKASGTSLGGAASTEASVLRSRANALNSDLSAAQGKLGQLEGSAGGGGVLGLGAAAGPAAIAAAATVAASAIVDFGVKSVHAYTKGAMAARSFQAISKASAEESSQFAFAAKETGIEADKLATAVFRLGKNVAAHADVLALDGIEVAKNADGSTNLAKTLVNVADAYAHQRDGAQAAKLGSDALGKSFASLAPLLAAGGDQLRYFFNEAEKKHLIFSDRDISQAAAFKYGMEGLHASVQGFLVSAGRPLTHELEMMAFGLTRLVDDIRDAPKHIPGLGLALTGVKLALEATPFGIAVDGLARLGKGAADEAEKVARLKDQWQQYAGALTDALSKQRAEYDALVGLPAAVHKLADAEQAVGDALQKRTDDAKAVVDAQSAITDAEDAAKDAHTASADAEHKLAEAQTQLNKVRADATAVAEELARAELDLQSKNESHRQALLDESKAQEDLDVLKLKGAGGGSRALAEAQLKLDEAHTKVASSALDEGDAQKKLDAERAGETQHAKDLAAAQDAVANASRGVESAHRSELKAVEAVGKARDAYQQALRTQKTDEDKLTTAIEGVQAAARAYADEQAKADGQTQASVAAASSAEVYALGILAGTYPQVAQIVDDAVKKINAAAGQVGSDNPLPAAPGAPNVPGAGQLYPPGVTPPVPATPPAPPPLLPSFAPYSRTAAPTPVIVNNYIQATDPTAAAREVERRTLISIPRHR